MNFRDKLLNRLIDLALEEDRVHEDVTTNSLLDFDSSVTAEVISKENGIIAGTKVFSTVFKRVDKKVKVDILTTDGSHVKPGDTVIRITGLKSSILRSERTALNFIQRLSGIATLTNKYVSKIKESGITLLDTRKTTPGMRYIEKEAVLAGGGTNHRMNLEDMAMIKDNHIKMAGSITDAITNVRKIFPEKKIEVEVTNISELSEAIKSKADIIMLDNFNTNLLKKAVSMKTSSVKYEISGNITIKNLLLKCIKGIDYISSGALTHSFRSLDLSLEIMDDKRGKK